MTKRQLNRLIRDAQEALFELRTAAETSVILPDRNVMLCSDAIELVIKLAQETETTE